MERDSRLVETADLSTLDVSARYSLVILGSLSGITSEGGQKSRKEEIWAIRILHGVCCLLMLTNLAFCLTFISSSKPTIQEFFFRLATAMWYAKITIANIILFIKSNFTKSMRHYYESLKELGKMFEAREIRIDRDKLARRVRSVLAGAWLFTVANVAFKIHDYATVDQQDPFTQNYYMIGWPVLGIISHTVTLIHWIMVPAYYIVLHQIVKTLFKGLHTKMGTDISASQSNFLTNLEDYRLLHLRLCDLVRKDNDYMSLVASCYMSMSILIVLLILYMESYHRQIESYSLVIVYLYWTVWEIALVFMFVVLGQTVGSATSRGHELLEHMQYECVNLTPNQLNQIQMFTQRLEKPEYLTVFGGLLQLKKSLGIKVAGAIISYYLIMLKFNYADFYSIQYDGMLNTTQPI